MVERRPDQAHRPGHVREDLIPKNMVWAGGAGPRPAHSRWLFRRCASAHRRYANQGRWPVGKDSLLNGPLATFEYRCLQCRERRKDPFWSPLA